MDSALINPNTCPSLTIKIISKTSKTVAFNRRGLTFHGPGHRGRLIAIRAAAGDEEAGPNKETRSSKPTGGSNFSLPQTPEWAKWAVGAVAWLSLPSWNKLKDVRNSLKRIDGIVETVEEIAEKVDDLADELVEELPEGGLKNLVVKFDKASELIENKAKSLDNTLDKITDILDKMKDKKDDKSKQEEKPETTLINKKSGQ